MHLTLKWRPLIYPYLVFLTFTLLILQKWYIRAQHSSWHVQFLTNLHPFQLLLLCLCNFHSLLPLFHIPCQGKLRYKSLIIKLLKKHLTMFFPLKVNYPAKIAKHMPLHTIIWLLRQNLSSRRIFLKAHSAFCILQKHLHQLYYDSTMRRRWLLVSTNIHQQERVQWNNAHSAANVNTTTETLFKISFQFPSRLLTEIVKL